MFKVILLFLIIFEFETFRAEIVFQNVKPTVNEPHYFNKDRNVGHFKYAPVQYNGHDFPPDTDPNFGDMIVGERQPNDMLLVRELIINEHIYDVDVPVDYTATFPGWNLTTVRSINIGRQRAYTRLAGYNNAGWIWVGATVKRREQIRLLIEAYGIPIPQ